MNLSQNTNLPCIYHWQSGAEARVVESNNILCTTKQMEGRGFTGNFLLSEGQHPQVAFWVGWSCQSVETGLGVFCVVCRSLGARGM